MTHVQFNTGVATLLLVEVHRGSFGFHVQNEEVLTYCHPLKMMPPHRKVPLPPGKWELFDIASDISEEEAMTLVDYGISCSTAGDFVGHRGFGIHGGTVIFHTAQDAVKSICTLHNLPFDRTVVLKRKYELH